MRAYTLIYCDPPWRYNSRANHQTRFRGGVHGHYGTMTLDEIAALPLASLAAPACALAMWCTFPYLDAQIQLCARWGFRYRTQIATWIKLNPRGYDLPHDDPAYRIDKPYVRYPGDGMYHSVFFGVGYYSKSNAEVLLLGMRGQVPTLTDSLSSVIMAPRREHSRKPDEAYTLLEALFGNVPRVELFARQARLNWDAYGAQLASDGADIRTRLQKACGESAT